MPDCDVFSCAGRSGRAAGAALVGSFGQGGGTGGVRDSTLPPPDLWEHLERHLNGALSATKGLGLLARLLGILEQYRGDHPELPFISDQTTEGRLAELERLEHQHSRSVLDLRLGRTARREIAQECLNPRQIVHEFVVEYLMGTIVFGRGGVIETTSAAWVRGHMDAIRAQFEPFANAAAQALLDRPDAIRLQLEAPTGGAVFDPITTNLLGAWT